MKDLEAGTNRTKITMSQLKALTAINEGQVVRVIRVEGCYERELLPEGDGKEYVKVPQVGKRTND